jgi:UTP--glucose-1-phosphate uridylyltransferase
MQITKAIIPVAGFGARRLPITKTIEKCMLPIGNRPIVDYVVQDCIAAGITDIYFVVSSTSTQLESYYSDNTLLNEYLISNNKQELLTDVVVPDVNFHYIIQATSGKYGTAIPVSLVAPLIQKGESVVVLMGDDFIYNRDGSSEIQRLIEATPLGGNSMLGVNILREQVSRYGVLELDDNNGFKRIVEKPTIEAAPSTLINVSKYVINYDLLQLIVEYSNKDIQDGEYYITDPINDYVASGGSLKVVPAVGEYLDGGTLDGWLHANNVVCSKK